MLLIGQTQIVPRAAASSSFWSGCLGGWVVEDFGVVSRRGSKRSFLDPGDPCRCVGGVNVEHAQRSEHERR